jgi:hypothetical protein
MIFFEKGREYAPSRKKSYPQSAKSFYAQSIAQKSISLKEMVSGFWDVAFFLQQAIRETAGGAVSARW